MRIGQGIFLQRLGMKWTYLLMILVRILLVLLILAIVGWLVLHLLVVFYSDGPARSHAEMKEQAEIAIKKVGGAAVLEKEAKAILSKYRARPGELWTDGGNDVRNYPVIMKLSTLLPPPYKYDFWVVEDEESLPAHVVIRFGSHAHYEYIWVFDPADMPLGKIEGVEHLGGTVYLSERSQWTF